MKLTFKKIKQETEANLFARCILMPSSLVREELKNITKKHSIEESVKQLAKKFKVSEVQMTLRLRDLKLL